MNHCDIFRPSPHSGRAAVHREVMNKQDGVFSDNEWQPKREILTGTSSSYASLFQIIDLIFKRKE